MGFLNSSDGGIIPTVIVSHAFHISRKSFREGIPNGKGLSARSSFSAGVIADVSTAKLVFVIGAVSAVAGVTGDGMRGNVKGGRSSNHKE